MRELGMVRFPKDTMHAQCRSDGAWHLPNPSSNDASIHSRSNFLKSNKRTLDGHQYCDCDVGVRGRCHVHFRKRCHFEAMKRVREEGEPASLSADCAGLGPGSPLRRLGFDTLNIPARVADDAAGGCCAVSAQPVS